MNTLLVFLLILGFSSVKTGLAASVGLEPKTADLNSDEPIDTPSSRQQDPTSGTVTLSLNLPIRSVEQTIPEIEESLTNVLRWRTIVTKIWDDFLNEEVAGKSYLSHNATDKNSPVQETNTTMTFISFRSFSSDGAVIAAERVKQKLKDSERLLASRLNAEFSLQVGIIQTSGTQSTTISVSVSVSISVTAVVVVVVVVMLRGAICC